jgi:SNF2 family DNA or RNA helicase
MNREGHKVTEDGAIIPIKNDYSTNEAYVWERFSVDDHPLYINRASEQVSIGVDERLKYARKFIHTGGILSDEMGLGKTVR